MELVRRPTTSQRPYLVFTSAGDRSNLQRWLRGRRDFDLWITYYGNRRGRYSESADFYNERKGSKFQNLKFAYDTWPDSFARYGAVMVMDDDVLIDSRGINRLFRIRSGHDLWVLQPAFDPRGKVSWDITRVDPRCRLRFTNFVEMTCPLFRQDKLAQFMAIYDPILVGFGVDWWFLHSMGAGLERRVAVVDEVVCLNPHDRTKGRIREIDRLQSTADRRKVWEEIKRKHAIRGKEQGFREFGSVPRPWHEAAWPVLKYCAARTIVGIRSVAWSLREWLRRRLRPLRPVE